MLTGKICTAIARGSRPGMSLISGTMDTGGNSKWAGVCPQG